jgi:hypothetical protein
MIDLFGAKATRCCGFRFWIFLADTGCVGLSVKIKKGLCVQNLQILPPDSLLVSWLSNSVLSKLVIFIQQWLYSPLLGPGRFFQFSNPIHSRYDSLDGGSARPKAATYTQDSTKHRINAHRHPCLEWDSNPRSQCSSERRQFMP